MQKRKIRNATVQVCCETVDLVINPHGISYVLVKACYERELQLTEIRLKCDEMGVNTRYTLSHG